MHVWILTWKVKHLVFIFFVVANVFPHCFSPDSDYLWQEPSTCLWSTLCTGPLNIGVDAVTGVRSLPDVSSTDTGHLVHWPDKPQLQVPSLRTASRFLMWWLGGSYNCLGMCTCSVLSYRGSRNRQKVHFYICWVLCIFILYTCLRQTKLSAQSCYMCRMDDWEFEDFLFFFFTSYFALNY